MAVRPLLFAGLGMMLLAAFGVQFDYTGISSDSSRLSVGQLAGWQPVQVFASEEERVAVEKILRYTAAHRFRAENGEYDILILRWNSGGDKVRDIVLHNPMACWSQTGWQILEATVAEMPIGPLWRGVPPVRCVFVDAHGRSLRAVFWRTSGGKSVPTWKVEDKMISGFGLLAGMTDAMQSRNKEQVFVRISMTGHPDEEALTRIASHFYNAFDRQSPR